MTAIGVVEVAACAVLAVRARRSGRDDRRRRYLQGVYGFLAWTGLCLARVLLLRRGG
jgi:hypothetical protein